jgi:hypothetical protein
MADRYWVGGTGTWNNTSTTNWSTTSGGASGASAPTSVDDVYLDSNSGVGNITTVSGAVCRSFYCANATTGNYSGTLTIGTAAFQSAFNSQGHFILSPSMTLTMANLVYFSICQGTGTWDVNFAGKSYGTTSIFTLGGGGPSSIVNLLSDITHDPARTGVEFYLAGTLITNNYNIQIKADNGNAIARFNMSSNSRLGSSVFSVQANNVQVFNTSSEVWQTSTILINKFAAPTSNTSIVIGSGSSARIGKLRSLTPTSITGNITVGDYTVVGPATVTASQQTVSFIGNATGYPIIENLSTESTAANRRIFITSGGHGLGQPVRINATTNLSDVDFRDLYVIGTNAPISGTRIGNRGNNTGITFTPAKNVYPVFNGTSAVNWHADIWSDLPGGTASLNNFPLAQDTVVIQNNSLTSISLNATASGNYMGTMDMSARTTALTLTFTNAYTCYGNWTNGSGISFSGSSALTFSGGSTQTITSAGKRFPGGVTIDTYGGTVQLADFFRFDFNSLITVTTGNFITNNNSIDGGGLSSPGTNVRSISLGSSVISLLSTVFSLPNSLTNPNLTFSAGTSQITMSNSTTIGFSGGGYTFNSVSFTNAPLTPHQISGANTFNSLSFAAPNADRVGGVAFSDNQIIGTLTCVGSSPRRRVFLSSNTMSTQRTLTVNSISSTDCDFRDINLAGAAAGASLTRAGDCGNNAGITFPAAKTVYWNLAGSQNLSSTGWAPASGGTPDINNFPLAQDTAVFDNAGAAGTVSIDASFNIGTLDMSARTTAMTVQRTNTTLNIYGDLKNGTGVTWSGSLGAFAFSKIGTQTITSNGTPFAGGTFLMFRPGSYVQLSDAFTFNGRISFGSGTFDAVTYNVTIAGVSASTTPLALKLKLGTATWTLTGTTDTFFIQGTVVIEGSATLVLSNNTTTSRNFGGNVGVYIQKLIIGGTTSTSTTTINGSNTFGELASTKTVAHTIAFGSNTNTIGKWSVTGTAGNVVTITGTSTTNVIAGPAVTGVDYLAMGSWGVSTTSPGEFYAGANSTGTASAPVFRTTAPAPRTLYWVGGTGNWSSTTKWSVDSGGASGQAIPTSLDNVVFNSASNATAYTATIDAGVGAMARCAALTMNGPASGNITFAGSSSAPIAIHGNATFAATGITHSYLGRLNLVGSEGGSYTLNYNGASVNVDDISFLGFGSWTLGGAVTIGTGKNFTLERGSLNTAGYTVTAARMLVNGTTRRSLTLGASNIINSTIGFTVTSGVNFTFDAGTSTITGTNASNAGITSPGLAFWNVNFTNTSSNQIAITGANTFNTLSIAGQTSPAIGINPVTFNANQTIGTLSITSGTNSGYRTWLLSDIIGTQRTLTVNSASIGDCDFRDIAITGTAAPLTGTRFGDCRGNSGITFPAAKTVYYMGIAGGSWVSNGNGSWALTSGGSTDATAYPLPQDTAVFTTNPPSGSSANIGGFFNIGTIDMSARTSNTMTLASGGNSFTVYGNWINGTGTTLSGSGNITFAGRGSQTIRSAGKTFTHRTTINTPGGSVTLQDAFTASQGAGYAFTAGTFDAASYNVTFNSGQVNTSGTDVRTIAFGSGTWTIGAGGSAFSAITSTNLTVTGTGTINLISASNQSFNGGNKSYSGITLNQGGAGALTISGNNTFKSITNSYSATGATSIILGGTTQTLTSPWTATGTVGKILTVSGSSPTSPGTLIFAGTGIAADVDYLIINNVRAYDLVDEWYAGTNSINAGSLGWIFSSSSPIVSESRGNFLMLL